MVMPARGAVEPARRSVRRGDLGATLASEPPFAPNLADLLTRACARLAELALRARIATSCSGFRA
jgi:hypothetical protein